MRIAIIILFTVIFNCGGIQVFGQTKAYHNILGTYTHDDYPLYWTLDSNTITFSDRSPDGEVDTIPVILLDVLPDNVPQPHLRPIDSDGVFIQHLEGSDTVWTYLHLISDSILIMEMGMHHEVTRYIKSNP
ncbi:MAG: hypothetical protein JKX73_07860 [Flavobacteriales bacterium]|nr:hypothetical protein [Flavobacteriales bacterium]